MEVNGTNIKQILSKKYCCKKCGYETERKSNIDNHFVSAKHLKEVNGTKIKQPLSNNFECEFCNKIYQTPAGLWKHKKKCKNLYESEIKTNSISEKNDINEKELIIMLLKQNSELMELIKNGTNNTNSHNTTTNTNSHNKAFNLNFFLNETCKDAMNIMDFVDSIQLQLSDLENVGKLGYVNGISNIIVKNLKELDIEKRPVHCTDKKRETMYVKDENKWEKDEKNNKIRKAIKRVVSKNQRLFPKFKEAHPDCNTYHSKFSDQYNKLILESCGGSGDNDLEKEEKIIQNISKNVLVDK